MHASILGMTTFPAPCCYLEGQQQQICYGSYEQCKKALIDLQTSYDVENEYKQLVVSAMNASVSFFIYCSSHEFSVRPRMISGCSKNS